MNKRASLPTIVVVIIVVLGLALTSSVIKNINLMNMKPTIKSLSINPTFIIPSYSAKNSADILAIITNPTDIDFRGKIQFIYDTDCLTIWQNPKDVSVNSKSENSFITTVQGINWNLPEKCYKTQTIIVKLTNLNSTNIYDSKEIQLTLTKQ
jgi:hypothetical protein